MKPGKSATCQIIIRGILLFETFIKPKLHLRTPFQQGSLFIFAQF